MYLKTKLLADTIRNSLERIRSLRGVVNATATCCVPLQGGYTLAFDIAGRPPVDGQHSGNAGWSTVSPGFFEVFQIPVKRGRVFTSRDDGKAPPVVVINETMAKKYWKDGDPLKDRIVIGKGVDKKFDDEPVRQIVGVVRDVRDESLDSIPRPLMYVPQAQLPDALKHPRLSAADGVGGADASEVAGVGRGDSEGVAAGDRFAGIRRAFDG